MWQSRVEIEGYSVAYFDRIAAFKAPYRLSSVKGEGSCALRRLVSYSYIYEARMSPTLKGSSAIRHFERSDVIEIRDGITSDFYTGLPHIYFVGFKINWDLCSQFRCNNLKRIPLSLSCISKWLRLLKSMPYLGC